ncbi:MAG: hypothetical protein WBC05_12795 [Sedimentisphaerales bacterium]
MKKSVSLLMVLFVSVLLAQYPRAESADVMTAEEDTIVKVVLTRLDVNDQTLEVGLKIINNTDHDVWVCNGYERAGGSIRYFDRFMEKDDKTLVLRRRYNLMLTWLERNAVPRNFRYLRLRPGQEKVESHSFTLPVTPLSVFLPSPHGNAESAQRMVIEIGFYDEELRALILGVVDMAERIGYDDSALSALKHSGPLALYYRFFGGFQIARLFKTENITYFRDSVTSDGDEILMPPMYQSLNGEQVLRIEVDNLPILF